MNANALALTGDLAASLATPPDTRDIELRHSMLKKMSQSPAHCYHAMVSGWDDTTLSKRLGSGVHSLLLGGAPVEKCTHRRGTNDYKQFVKDHPDAILLTPAEYSKAQGIAAAVKADERASRVLYAPESVYETTIHWEWLGRKRRTTPDVRNASMLCELKTTRAGSPDRFKWEVIRYSMHAQLADQANAIEFATGLRPREVFICAVETTPPYVPVVYRLTANDLEAGERLNRAWMERLLICEATGQFPGYAETIMDLDLPGSDDGLVFEDDDGEEVTTEGSEL